MSLRFAFGATENEIEQVLALAQPFLQSPHQIQTWLDALRRLEKQPAGSSLTWSIDPQDPISTKPSDGQYHPGGRGALEVYATISTVWHIRSMRRNKRIFEIFDNASTTVTILDAASDDEVARWNFDIGTATSPGCHFHAQLPAYDALGLDVPRLPIPFILPTDALDYVLGELFQVDWAKRSLGRNDAFQRERLVRVFEWFKDAIDGSHAAWIQLKGAKPSAELLLA